MYMTDELNHRSQRDPRFRPDSLLRFGRGAAAVEGSA